MEARRSSRERPVVSWEWRLSSLISAPRTAFIRAASKVWAMDMTSPVAFIWEPNFRLAPWNLSKGHLGNFTTT